MKLFKPSKKIVALICSIFTVIIILMNSTYSLLFRTDETDLQNYTTGMLTITSSAINNSVTLTNALPMEDSVGEVSTPYTFRITNEGSVAFRFDVKLLSTSTENQIDPQYIKIKVDDGEVMTLNSLTDGIILEQITLNPSRSVDIDLRVWLDINTPNTQIGKTFNAKIVTEGQAVHANEVVITPGIDNSGANFPQLTDGLVPVEYNDNIMEWVRADTSGRIEDSWYNYDDKMWANAVLVKNEWDSITLVGEYYFYEPVDSSDTYYSIPGDGAPISFKTNDRFGDDTVSFDFKLSTYVEYSETGNDYERFEYINGDPASFFNDWVTIEVDGVEYPVDYDVNSMFVNGEGTWYEITGTFFMYFNDNGGEPHEIIIRRSWDETNGTNLEISNFSTSYSDETDLRVRLGYWSTVGHEDYPETQYVSSSYSLVWDPETYGGGYFVLDDPQPIYNYYQDLVGMYMCTVPGETTCDEIYKITDVDDSGDISKAFIYDYDGPVEERDYLLSEDSVATIIREEDILAHYVWIPRFKYKVWNKDKVIGVDSYNAKTTGIDIVFENGIDSTGTVVCDDYDFTVLEGEGLSETCTGTNGVEYYTHPAFTFGNDELTGFWIGKFELSSTDQTKNNYGGGLSTTLTPRILPNVISWKNNSVSNFYTVIKNMQTSNNIYGLSTDITVADSHMLTNMEWGAVAYLTNSKYGRCTGGENSICTEVSYNDSGTDVDGPLYTGRSSGDPELTDYSENGSYTYKEVNGQLASTTGNIYGVYDMSGGSWELVMGSMSSQNGSYTFDSQFAGNNYSYDEFTTKYLTTYSYGTIDDNQIAYNRARLGDATGEIVSSEGVGWYDDNAKFHFSSRDWFARGGYFVNVIAGAFSFGRSAGDADTYGSTRASLVVFP